jgi:outer membrane immunogenic protein
LIGAPFEPQPRRHRGRSATATLISTWKASRKVVKGDWRVFSNLKQLCYLKGHLEDMLKFRLGLLGLTLTSALALAAFSANAADMYVPAAPGGYKDGPSPVYSWAGFYAGVNGGYGWGTPSSKVFDLEETAGGALIAETTKSFTPAGGFGGGQIGYNWQRDRLVFGLEADIQGADIHGDATTSVLPGVSASGSTSLDWFGTVRGRLGYACGTTLLYATGGFAYGDVHDKLSKVDTAGSGSLSHSEVATGYVVGGGVEYSVSPTWSVKAEYQFMDLGKGPSLSVDAVAPVKFFGVLDPEHAYSTVRVGLNYHVAPAYEPLK